MAVIISEFEIMADANKPRDQSGDAPAREAAARPMRPDEVVLVMRRETERQERLRAD